MYIMLKVDQQHLNTLLTTLVNLFPLVPTVLVGNAYENLISTSDEAPASSLDIRV